MRWLILLPLLLAGCASTSEVTTRYRAGQLPPAPERLLLVARTPEQGLRREWENSCAAVLELDGLTITRSHKVLPEWFEPDSEAPQQWARRHGADMILLGELTGLLLRRPEPTSANDRHPPSGGIDDPMGESVFAITLAGKQQQETPASGHREFLFHLLNADGKTLWSGATRTHEANEVAAIARSQCHALKQHLTETGLLPAPH